MSSSIEIALQWRTLRAKRLELERLAKKIKTDEDNLKIALIARLSKATNKALSFNGRLVQLVVKEQPVASDWPALWKHIQKTGAFELVQQRLSIAAVEEHWEAGEKIPGVSKLPVESLSDTQAK